MVDKNKLRAEWVKKGLKQSEVANIVGVSQKTFSLKLNRGIFGSDEIEAMISALDIADPVSIFFANSVTCKVTKPT